MKFIINLTLLIFTKLLLEYSYINFVVKYFKYEGFEYIFVLDKYIYGWIAYIVIYLILYKKRNLYIYEIHLILFLILILPHIVYYSLSDQNTFFFSIILLIYISTVIFVSNKNLIKIKKIKKGKPFILLISSVFTIIVLIKLILDTQGHMVLNFADVYDFRIKFEDKSGGILVYLNGWVVKVLAPLLLAWSIQMKKKLMIIISTFFILGLFVFSGHKGVLQGIILVLFFYNLYKMKHIETKFIFSFFLLILLTVLISFYFKDDLIGSLLIRRLLFVPAQLNFIWFEFFSNNPFDYWSEHILRSFIDYPYNNYLAYVVGGYMGYPKMSANTGFIALGYAHAGYIGIFIYTTLVVVMLNMINTFGKKMDKYIFMSIIFIPISVLYTSGDMFTTLLTHGLFVAILVLWLYENKSYNIKFGRWRYKI